VVSGARHTPPDEQEGPQDGMHCWKGLYETIDVIDRQSLEPHISCLMPHNPNPGPDVRQPCWIYSTVWVGSSLAVRQELLSFPSLSAPSRCLALVVPSHSVDLFWSHREEGEPLGHGGTRLHVHLPLTGHNRTIATLTTRSEEMNSLSGC